MEGEELEAGDATIELFALLSLGGLGRGMW